MQEMVGVLHYMKPSGCVSEPHVVQFPRLVTVQTSSVKYADNGVLWAKWSAFWEQRCLSWRVVRM